MNRKGCAKLNTQFPCTPDGFARANLTGRLRLMASMADTNCLDNSLNRLGENERHFQTTQAGIRGIASTWTLTACAGVALLFKREPQVAWLLPPYALVTLIASMTNIGLGLLWILDQLVYQRLFNTNYIAGLRLETQFSFIPPVRAIQALSTGGTSIAVWVKYFYVIPMLAFATIAVFGVASYFGVSLDPWRFSGWAVAVGLSGSLLPMIWVIHRARGVDLFRFAGGLPKRYSTLVEKQVCIETIERHLIETNAGGAEPLIGQ